MARSGIMLCYPFEEKRLEKWQPPYILQPKLDGVRCRAVRNNAGVYTLLSSEEKEIVSMPHVVEALNSLPVKVKELDGELYCHGLPFEEIVSATSRSVNLHPEYQNISYHIFDLVSEFPQSARLMTLRSISQQFATPLQMVDFLICENLDEILKGYDHFVAEGYEGIIVRHIDNSYIRRRSTLMMKFKPKKDDYYLIIGWKEEISIHGEPKGRLGALICSGGSGDTFAVGTGFCEEDRRNLWKGRESLIGKLAHVKYQHVTAGRGVPRFPVFVEIIEREPTEVGLRT